MPSQRIERVQNLLREEISTLVLRRVKDPRVGRVTITMVQVAPDLRQARVFVSAHGAPEERTEALRGLDSAAGYIRQELMKVLHLRPMPSLEFHLDESLERGSHTLDILDQIADEHDHPQARPEPGDRADPQQR